MYIYIYTHFQNSSRFVSQCHHHLIIPIVPRFLWMLVTSMLCQTVAGTAFARIHVAAAQQLGGSQQAGYVWMIPSFYGYFRAKPNKEWSFWMI